MMDYLNISGKTAIVTGGARGIGKSIAEELAQFGVAVILADVKKEEGQDVEKSIIYAGGKAKYIYCDVSDDNNIHSLVGETIEHFGGVDILVNDAGIGAYEKPFEEMDCLEQVGIVMNAKSLAEKSLSKIIQSGGK